MYSYFRRDFNLASYKLDDVAGQYISDNIKHVQYSMNEQHGEVTELLSKNLSGLHIGDFIHIELNGFTSDYYQNGRKFRVIDIEMGREIDEKGKFNVIFIKGRELTDNTCKNIKWCMAKDDVTPQDIFRLSKGSSADRAVVAKYCIQDCNLVHHLMNKIDVLTGYVEMSRICSVPISFLVFRGQGIKLTSYVAKKCREKNTLMPDLEKGGANDGYEGAIVLPPKCSMYMDNPVACVDYASLYPSSMISQNYSHDSKVWTKEYDFAGELVKVTGECDKKGNFIYDNLPGFQYIDIEFDTYKYVRKTPTSSAEKVISGKKICRWAQLPNHQKSIMPSILEELLKARKDTRKKIKTEPDPFMKNILDKRQLGYKVTANSLYGQCGAKTSTFYEQDVAASTTATGRMMITYAKRMIEEVYGDRLYDTLNHGTVKCNAEYIYGDSVAKYTPVYVRVNNQINICEIATLAVTYGNNNWITCTEAGKQDKEFCELYGVESWTDSGWTQLHRVIRHKLASHKRMMRVLTHTGVVDVTDDHSLLLTDGSEISPNDVQIGTKLLHRTMVHTTENLPSTISFNEAVSYGVLYRNQFIQESVPVSILNGSFKIRYAFWDALVHRQRNREINGVYMKSPMIAAQLCWVAASIGRLPYLLLSKQDPTIHVILENDERCFGYNKNFSEVTQINEIEYNDYVYDLTTENHHFAAGVGNMIVHNTDSVFFTFNLENPNTSQKIRGQKALDLTIEIAQDAANLCTQFLKAPQCLEYEKTLMPFILLSKKRYVGMLYEEDPTKGYMKYMGLSLKRRDSCDYLKDTYGGILNILMKENDIQKAIEFLYESLDNLIEGNVPMDKLTITKALRSDYKNPMQIGHWVLAERIGKRDPGNRPKPGDRMKFVFIVNPDRKALMGDKIETPEFITEHNLQIDYTHYITNQLMKPLQQLFGLALEPIWEHQNKTSAIKTYRREMAAMESQNPDQETFMKKKEKYCSSKVKKLLFDKFLTKIENKRTGMQSITAFFG